jgi:hypothetical protein
MKSFIQFCEDVSLSDLERRHSQSPEGKRQARTFARKRAEKEQKKKQKKEEHLQKNLQKDTEHKCWQKKQHSNQMKMTLIRKLKNHIILPKLAAIFVGQ